MINHLDFYTDEQLELRRRYLLEVKKIDRPGIYKLINFLDKSNFYNAPASTRYHLAEESGLVKHSLLVLETAKKLNKALGNPVSDDSLIVVSLFHDLGKHRYFGKDYYLPKFLKSGKPAKTPYERNKDLSNIPHEIISLQLLSDFIQLTEEETWAILHHNGMYGDLKYTLQGNETELQQIVHNADMWASRFLENRS